MKQNKTRKGRPTKYSRLVKKTICDAVADGTPYSLAAAIGGISYETFCEWRRSKPEFSDAIDKAIAKGVHARLQLILESAKGGNVKAATWWLEHVMPEHFSRNCVNLNHRIEGELRQSVAVSPETLAEIAKVRSRHDCSG